VSRVIRKFDNFSRLLVAAIFLAPLFLAFIAAFRPDQEMFRYGGQLSLYTFFPNQPTLANFDEIIHRAYFLRQIANTLFVGVVQSTLTVIVGVLAAFPLARMRFIGRDIIFFAILATMFVPFEAMVVPLFMLIRSMDMLNNYWGLMLPWISSPVAVFLLRQSMQEIPLDLD
jgi:ABC-type glycerol-3-phosphate transport system permease component